MRSALIVSLVLVVSTVAAAEPPSGDLGRQAAQARLTLVALDANYRSAKADVSSSAKETALLRPDRMADANSLSASLDVIRKRAVTMRDQGRELVKQQKLFLEV